MRSRHTGLVAAAAVLLLSLASTAQAAVLWDQSNWNPNGEGSLNLNSTSCSQISGNTKAHTASDVHFDGPVTITSVKIYETFGNVETATMAYLHIEPKTGPFPTAPTSVVTAAANFKPITISYETVNSVQTVVVTCPNLNIALPAGDYWVSLTPRHSRGVFPYAVHRVTTGPILGDPTRVLDACTENSNWLTPLNPPSYDYAIKIEGDRPVPAIPSSWGGVKAFYR
jgi:hypothetical protein